MENMNGEYQVPHQKEFLKWSARYAIIYRKEFDHCWADIIISADIRSKPGMTASFLGETAHFAPD